MTMDSAIEPGRAATCRPRSVTLLSWLVLIIAGFYLLRLVQTLSQWNFLLALGAISPLYLAVSAILWACVAFTLFWGLWQGKSWAPRATRLASILFILWFWIDNLILTNPAGRGTNSLFQISVQLILLSVLFIILSRPAAITYFRRPV